MSKNHYDVLEVASTAPADEIKRAFRVQIALYHPDKVQHLGKEFQEMAAGRATALTEAYRVLSNESQRAAYDRALAAAPPSASPGPSPTAPSPEAEPPRAEPPRASPFTKERAGADQILRKATLERIRQALALAADYDETKVRGFDIALVPKPKMFGGGKRPRVLGRFVDPVDAAAVADSWSLAVRWISSPKDEICVFLLGSSLAPPRELADAIAEQRRKHRTANLTIIPVDVRTWDAHVPVDTPAVCKNLLTRLKCGN
jgi:curved DNA-binding protein CbpA